MEKASDKGLKKTSLTVDMFNDKNTVTKWSKRLCNQATGGFYRKSVCTIPHKVTFQWKSQQSSDGSGRWFSNLVQRRYVCGGERLARCGDLSGSLYSFHMLECTDATGWSCCSMIHCLQKGVNMDLMQPFVADEQSVEHIGVEEDWEMAFVQLGFKTVDAAI